MSDTATLPKPQAQSAAQDDALIPLTESDLRQLNMAFARHMRDPSTVPAIMRQFFQTHNMLIQRVKNLEARLKATDKKSPPPASSKATDDLSNV
jgi:hypothetical protein